jgi:hypothetical protein
LILIPDRNRAFQRAASPSAVNCFKIERHRNGVSSVTGNLAPQVTPAMRRQMRHRAPDNRRDKLLALHRGDVIQLQGFLVRAEAADGWRWRSSFSRTDTGSGSCEVIWVNDVALKRTPSSAGVSSVDATIRPAIRRIMLSSQNFAGRECPCSSKTPPRGSCWLRRCSSGLNFRQRKGAP